MVTNAINHQADGSVASDLVKGAFAGAVVAVAMDRVGWAILKRESIATLKKESEARPFGMDPAHIMANRLANSLGFQLKPQQPHPAGIAMFFVLAMLPGAFYGVLLKRVNHIGFA